MTSHGMDDILSAIRRPLEFAARNGYANVMALRGLERTVDRVIDRGLSLAVDPAARARLEALRVTLAGFDRLPAEGRRERIEAARRLLDAPLAPERECAARSAARAKPGALAERCVGGTPAQAPREARLPADPAPPPAAPLGDPTSMPLRFMKGVGPKLAEALARKGLVTVEDALYFLPRTYEDRRRPVRIAEARPGMRVVVLGEVVAAGPAYFGGRRRGFEMGVADGSGVLRARWFHAPGPAMQTRFPKGTRVLVSGEVQRFGGRIQMVHPDIEPAAGADDPVHFNRIVPVYSEADGVPQKTLRRILKSVVDACADAARGGLPPAVAADLRLLPLPEALRAVHFPPSEADPEALAAGRTPAHRTLILDELFVLQLGLALRRRGLALEPAPVLEGDGCLATRLRERLPFALTRAQERVVAEIAADLASGHPMHRLLQGDVGSGKTLVALLAALTAIESGYQAALMAPTELLAEQHYLTAHRLLAPLGLEVLLLTGAQAKGERARVLRRIEQGEAHLVVGTHAVIQEQVTFRRLGLGVIDEQHRFGVAQRATLAKKGERPHRLVMTATPIPRTLAMTVYGDLDVSVLDELPPGRSPIATRVVWPRQRREVLEATRARIARGEQAYVVYPLVEESEAPELADLKDATAAAEELAAALPGTRVSLLHGRMPPDEKESVMAAFRDRRLDVLVATTVVEVGIDVPNATLMVIEHAERFGLSQLHQLRGRVGRGSRPSTCLLVASGRRTEEAARRLAVMEQTTDGFRIAEEDLAIRGPGDVLGTRQSGLPDFRIANLFRDQRLLAVARDAAFALVARDPELADPAHRLAREALARRWGGRLALAGA
jgi:ATP-dependent DNA helicase RecG